MPKSPIDRRRFLRGTGVALALPLLDAMTPRLHSAPPTPPKRFVAVCATLGLHAEHIIPQSTGKAYDPPIYLKTLAGYEKAFTVFSGLSHPEVDGGHDSEACFLTAAPHPGRGGFRNSISLDQLAREKLSPDTRYGSLTLTTAGTTTGLSFTRNGIAIPADNRPSQVFARLFLDGTPQQVRDQVRRFQEGQSIIDTISDESKRLERELGARDRQKLDEYFSAIREVEHRLQRGEEWARKPKPKITAKPPRDITSIADFYGRGQLMFDLAHLALETDSTRFITIQVKGHNQVPPLNGVTSDWHNLSHHGRDPEKIAQLQLIELKQVQLLGEFLSKLRTTQSAGKSLLDQTTVLFGSNLGNASSHDTKNLPIVLAGGSFQHGEHLGFDRARNVALGRLFVNILQEIGVEADQFASGRGTLDGLKRG